MSDFPKARWLLASGTMMVASGLFHVFVWLVLGGTWEGSVSWRKPILFGLSTGVTVMSLGWIYPKLEARNYDRYLLPTFCVAMLWEVGIITLQQWRGVASHFNRETPFDAAADTAVTLLIVFASIVIGDLALRCFQRLSARSDVRLAIRSGMAFLVASMLLGYWILFYGEYAKSVGGDPHTFGAEGVMKFPHGIAIHAIQGLPILGWSLSKLGFDQRHRYQSILAATVSLAVLLLFSLYQTLNGRARFDLDAVAAVLLVISAAPVLVVLATSVLAGSERGT